MVAEQVTNSFSSLKPTSKIANVLSSLNGVLICLSRHYEAALKFPYHNYGIMVYFVYIWISWLPEKEIEVLLFYLFWWNILMGLGWTSTRWSGITCFVSKDNKPAPRELCFHWQVCVHMTCFVFNTIFDLIFHTWETTTTNLFAWLSHGLFIVWAWTKCFVLNSLCQECQTLIDNHDQIKLLSNVRNNLNTTLKVGFQRAYHIHCLLCRPVHANSSNTFLSTVGGCKF